MIKEHIEKKTITEVVDKPEHGERNTSAFRKSVQRLKDDGHYHCYMFGCKNENMQVHHRQEFSNENTTDFNKLKEFLLGHDVYGYSRLMQNLPITSIDDVRNLLVLCREHHNNVNEVEGNGTGIHNMTEPAWVAQCVSIDGENPVPQEGETIAQVLERVK